MFESRKRLTLVIFVVCGFGAFFMFSHKLVKKSLSLPSNIKRQDDPGQQSGQDRIGQAGQFVALQSDTLSYSASAPGYNISATSKTRVSVDELTRLLTERLALPNNAAKIVYDTPCQPESKNLTGCTGQCANAPSLDTKPLRDRVSDLVESPMLKLSDQQRATILSITSTVPETDVIIVTAASSNHFSEMQAMFQNLHSVVYPIMADQKRQFSVVVFDLGLTPAERKLTEEKCRCQVLSFPTSLFPPHVKDNHCYSWKPIIIRAITERARKHIVWQDASIRWTKDFLKMFDNVPRYGHQIIRYMASNRVTANTLKETFDYLKEDTCLFFPYPEVQASVQLHASDPVTIQAILDPWCRCALEKMCICPRSPPGSVLRCSPSKTIHRCHRFDQSALTIVLAKLYASEMYKVMAPEWNFKKPNIVEIKREHKMPKYFKNL